MTFEITEKIPFILKRNQIHELIKKGIVLEILYSDSIAGQFFILPYVKILN